MSEPAAPPEVDEVREFRAAARELARAKGRTHREKLSGFVRLSELARRSTTRELSQRAIWVEFDRWLRGDAIPPGRPDPVENACRGLRREGYERCPSCRRSLPTDDEMRRWRRMRDDAIAEVAAFEGAVS